MTPTPSPDAAPYYYLDKHQEVVGPMPLSVIRGMVRAGSLSDTVLVAREGASSWTPLNALNTPPSVPGGPKKRGVVRARVARTPVMQHGLRQPLHPVGGVPPRPESHLAWAILVTVFCCLPCGIVAIVRASTVESRYRSGEYAAAAGASESAYTWCLWGTILGLISGGSYLVYYI